MAHNRPLDFKQFGRIIKEFKCAYKIKSLRREVFGVSESQDEMHQITQHRRKLFAVPGIIEFVTDERFVSANAKLALPESKKDDSELTQKGKKYLSIILGRIQLQQLKNPKKYQGKILYDLKSRAQATLHQDKKNTLIQLRGQTHSIPAFSQFDTKGNLLDFSYNNSIRYYFNQIYKNIFRNTPIPENVHVDSNIHYSQTLLEVFNKNYIGKKYLILFYAHKALHVEGYHTSLLLCKIKDDKIDLNQVINIDGYHFPQYVDIIGETEQGVRQKQSAIKQRIIIAGLNGNLQPPSYSNMNCPVYAATFAKAIVNIINDRNQISLVDGALNACSHVQNPKSITIVIGNKQQNTAQIFVNAIGEQLRGIYVAQLSSNRDDAALQKYHRQIRIQVAASFLKDDAKPLKPQAELLKPSAKPFVGFFKQEKNNNNDSSLLVGLKKYKKLLTQEINSGSSNSSRKTCKINFINKLILEEKSVHVSAPKLKNKLRSALGQALDSQVQLFEIVAGSVSARMFDFLQKIDPALAREAMLLSELHTYYTELGSEVKSNWPYPNKDLKRKKIEFLNMLFEIYKNNSHLNLSASLNQLKGSLGNAKFNEHISGKLSWRLDRLVEKIMNPQEINTEEVSSLKMSAPH